MKTRLISSAMAVTPFIMAALYSSPAIAIKCTLTQECIIAIDKTKASINSNIDQMDSNIAREVNRARTDIIEALGKQTSSISGQQAQAVETQTRHAEEVAKANKKMEVVRTTPKLGCGVTSSATGPTGGGVAKTSVGQGRKAANSSVPERLKKAWDQSDPNAPVLPPSNPNISRVDLGVGSCQGFAGDPNSARGLMCRQVNGLKIDSNPYADADIKAETLFDGPQQKGNEQLRLTVTAKERTPERDARKAIINQYSDPISPPGISASAASSSEGVAYIGALTAYNAYSSLASKPVRDWDALTTADPETIPAVKALVDDPVTGQFVANHLKSSYPNWASEGVSPVELMYLEAEKRTGNPDWMVHMSGADAPEKEAEMLFLMAYQQRFMFQQLQETRRQNVLLGQLLSLQLKETAFPDLERLAAQANKVPARFDNQRPASRQQ
ncbi:hypothetical protein PuT2_11425 [Pusillimonas sp. T2]|uniref:hypothetical protein n=1 Tax=Pusillimonas sp. T2 TaxID=1548123 RepID=UPI000B9D1DE2|nr:hypothetical protein [Pusillimonas sp. T2]OXR48577.1 hypothetical protein PuT2_11425 [Pusillimonas sp. T2]